MNCPICHSIMEDKLPKMSMNHLCPYKVCQKDRHMTKYVDDKLWVIDDQDEGVNIAKTSQGTLLRYGRELFGLSNYNISFEQAYTFALKYPTLKAYI